MELNEISSKANGGTELMVRRLYKELSPELLSNFQIIPSRVRELDDTKYRILWNHDLAEDPEAEKALANGGWKNFHRIVFVSHWQMQSFIARFNIPWSKCVVLQNAIDPIQPVEMDSYVTTAYAQRREGHVNLIYTPTPHRGLQILYPVFEKLAQEDDNISLDVFSSFKLYGWEERDAPYKELFDKLEAHPQIRYHGSQPNGIVRQALAEADIFAYPSIWPETSCICLIEAMSAGLLCLHPDYAALPETAANWTYMYHWDEDMNRHASQFYQLLRTTIQMIRDGRKPHPAQKHYADAFYSWEARVVQWEQFLTGVLEYNEPRALPQQLFTYKMGP